MPVSGCHSETTESRSSTAFIGVLINRDSRSSQSWAGVTQFEPPVAAAAPRSAPPVAIRHAKLFPAGVFDAGGTRSHRLTAACRGTAPAVRQSFLETSPCPNAYRGRLIAQRPGQCGFLRSPSGRSLGPLRSRRAGGAGGPSRWCGWKASTTSAFRFGACGGQCGRRAARVRHHEHRRARVDAAKLRRRFELPAGPRSNGPSCSLSSRGMGYQLPL